MEAAGRRYIWHRSTTDVFRIWNLSDLHWMSKACAETEIRRDVQKIADDPFSFWVGGGDMCDFIGYSDKRFDPDAVAEWVSVKDLGNIGRKGMECIRDLFQPIKHKCFGMVIGNHEKKYELHKEHEGMHAWLCTELGVANLGYCALFDVIFCRTSKVKEPVLKDSPPGHNETTSSSFRIFVHHGAGYAQTPGGKLNRLVQFMNSFRADVYFCLSDDTEILTTSGWKRHCDLAIGEQIWGFNNGRAVRDNVVQIHRLKYDGEMLNLKNRSTDQLVTPDHEIVYRQRKRDGDFGAWRKATAESLRGFASHVYLPAAGRSCCDEYPLSDDELALAGWIVAEGHFHKTEPKGGCGISVFQSVKNAEKTEQIRGILDRLELKYKYHIRNSGAALFYICAESAREIQLRLVSDKGIPRYLHDVSDRQFRVFLNALVDGDGHRVGDNCATVYSQHESFIDDLQAVAVTHGMRAIKRAATSGFAPHKINWQLRMCDRRVIAHPFSKRALEPVEYDGTVWCVTTKSGAFFARRNGYVFVTGNCGHVHDQVARREPCLGADSKCSKIVQYDRIGAVSGSYLKTYQQGHTSYGEMKGYRPTSLGAAVISIHPESRRMEAAV